MKKKLSKISVLLVLMLTLSVCFAFGASAETFTGDCSAEGSNVTWTFDSETGELVISGEGAMYDYVEINEYGGYGNWGERPEFEEYKDVITSVVIENGITRIGGAVFQDYDSITSVEIAETVTEIGWIAFDNCASLANLELSEGLTTIQSDAFNSCSALVSVTLPDSVKTIEEETFANCEKLTTINIPSVTTFGERMFNRCSNLSEITIDEGLTSIGRDTFLECTSLENIILPKGVTSIGEWAFYGCTNLKTVTLSEGIETIGELAFVDCTNLETINLPEGLTTIGSDAFRDCHKLDTDIPSTVTSIGEYAFYRCSSLKKAILSEGIAVIEPSTFEYCESITEATIPDSVTSIGESAFNSCSIKNLKIPGSVKTIGGAAFSNNILETLIIEKGVESIGYRAFEYGAFESVTLPDTVKEIGPGAFWDCEKLKSIVIPEGVEVIEQETFTFSGIESIELPESLTSIGERAFQGTNITEITIPKNVSYIGSEALTRSYALEYINVAEGNAYFCNDEYGALYDIAKENLIQYPVGNKNTSYIVPETVTNICSSAVDGGLYLKNITLPEGLKTIDSEAFISCAVSEIILPSTLESIGWGAFTNCIFLEELVIPESVKTIGDSIVYSLFPVDVYVESMDAVIDEAAFGFGNMVVEGISKEDFFDLFVKIYTAPTGTSAEDLEKLENNALQYVTMYDEPIPFGKIYCHEGSTTETNIETLIDEYGFAADYEYTHFFKNWTYDWDNFERTAKCIHCDETTTEALEKPENIETETEIEIIAPVIDEDTKFVVETVEDEASEDYILVTEALEAVEGPAEIEKIYDITLQNSDNVAIQPDGSVQVKLPVENTHENYKVFRVNEDGTYTDMNATVVDGYVVFVTDHFSLYVIVDTTEAHEHSYTEEITKPATHMEEGEKTFTCSACGDSYTEVIEKDPKHYAELKYKSATCTEDGYERAVCECGFVMVDKVYEKLGHFYNYTVTLHPTHTREGSEIADCIRCDDTFTNTIDKLPDHYYGYFVKTYDPTCTEGGYTVHQCSCGDSYTDSYTSALGHTRSKNGDWCSVCGVDMEPEKKDCDHMCHQSGFMGFIWSIVQFFWKLFKMNPVCECGAAHY